MNNLLLYLAMATAAEPQISIEKDGTVAVALLSDHAHGFVTSVIADPMSYGRIEDRVKVEVISDDGICPVMQYSSPEESYRVKMCRKSNGFQLDLVESDSLKFYRAVWKLEKSEKGTRIEYRIRVETKAYIPMFLVSRKLRGDVAAFFEKFQTYLDQEANKK